MSYLKDKSLQYKTEIKNNFESFDPNNKGIIETQKLNDFINSINSKKKNPFIYNFIKSLTALKKQENEEGISSEEYISFIDNKLNDDKSNEGLKNIFNVFCDGNTGNISWNTFPLIARELGNNEIADKLLEIIKQSKMYTKELNFKEFFELMNNEYDDYSNYTFKNENSENSDININNLKINEYLDIDEKPTYKQRRQILQKLKENESSMTSSKNSIQDNDEIFVEEKYYNNQRPEEVNKDNDYEKTNKRYHRRYRSKKIKNHNSNNLNENDKNVKNQHKSYTKYRKNHINY
jgi:Ca2+-binding EF-hand superfamily protein